jgi:hypothetical protein
MNAASCARTACARVPTAHVEPILHLPTIKAFSISVAFLKPKAENLTLGKLPRTSGALWV